MSRKMELNDEVVKYIFGYSTRPDVLVGEDGYIVYNFKTTFPSKLAVFVPLEVEGSNYSNFFPKSFEEYFKDLDLEISRLSLLLEQGNVFRRFPKTEFVLGKVTKTSGDYVVFQFDSMLDVAEKTELLCRTPVDVLSLSWFDECTNVSDVKFAEYVDMIYGERFLYWFLPVRQLFVKQEEDMEWCMPIILESLCR